jgi:hypothetical protein
METEKSWVKTYNWVMKLLAQLDFADAGRRMGLRLVSPAELEVDFAGRTYAIRPGAITLKAERVRWSIRDVTGGEMSDYNIRSTLGYYALSPADIEPAEDFCLLENFSHGVFDQRMDGIFTPLRKEFGDNYGRFRAACEALGMQDEGAHGSGRQWRYQLLPKLPVRLVYYEGDDEFPTDIKVLWDKNAIVIYKFEPLAQLAGCFMNALAAVGRSIS